MKAELFLLFLFSFLQMLNTEENKKFFFKCGVDDYPITPKPALNSTPIFKDKRKLDDDGFKDFHIYLDLLNIQIGIKRYHLEEYEELFINSLKKVVKTLQTLLRVKPHKYAFIFYDEHLTNMGIEDWNRSMIGNKSLGSTYDLGVDLYIFGKFDENMDALATAGPVYMNTENMQPLVGIVNINAKVNYSKINSEDYFQSIIIHEFTHILGFLHSYFKDVYHNIFSRVDDYGIMRTYINSSKVIEVAKKYYNCPDVDGIELEESGGGGTAGSHWEARILLGDYMNGVVYPEEQVVSEFTLALLEDTGFYKANYYTGGLMRYGKGKGCDFIKKRCVNPSHEINPLFENEFYDSLASGFLDASCTSGRQSRTYYAWWQYGEIPEEYRYFENEHTGGFSPADFCPVAKEYGEDDHDSYYIGHCSHRGSGKYGNFISNKKEEIIDGNPVTISFSNRSEELYPITGETLSDHSYCYLSSLIKNEYTNYNLKTVRAICYESFCSDNSLTIKILDDYIVCPRSGGKIEVEGYNGYFLCPDYNLICTGTVLCNDLFDCVNKKSEFKPQTFNYDYEIKTSQNIENAEIAIAEEETNYELSSNGICTINCKYCKLNKICKKCRNDYGLVGSKENEEVICLPLSQLNIGYYKNNNNIYYRCMDHCDTCKDDISCEVCSSGFIYINNKCITPIENCEIYGADDKCNKCQENYALKEDNREECFSMNLFENYYTENDGISYYPCENKISKCSKCVYDKNDTFVKCFLCLNNYALYKNEELCLLKENINRIYIYLNETHIDKCSNIIGNCSECENNNTCLKCLNNYYMINDDKFNCFELSQFSRNNYYLNNEKTIYYSCNNTLYHNIENCKECINREICSICQDEYTFIDGDKSSCVKKEILKDKYIPDPLDSTNYIKCSLYFDNCNLCNNTQCISCEDGFVLTNDNNCVLNSSLYADNHLTSQININEKGEKDDNDNYFEIFIFQVQIINKRFTIYATFSMKLSKDFHIKLSVDLYKSQNKKRILQGPTQKDYEVNLYINRDNNLESGKIIELVSEEQFSDSDRIVINQNNENYDFGMKVLDNNNKILDTEENTKMINSMEMIDFSLLPADYPINIYYIKSSSSGCEFDLISNTQIKEKNQDIILNFVEKNNNNVKINVQCIFSKDNNDKIPCSLDQEINNNNYILDSYIGSSSNGIFNIMPERDKEFQLNCEKKNQGLSKGAIVGICLGAVGFLIIVIIIIVCICKKNEKIEYENVSKKKESRNIRLSSENPISSRNSTKKIKVYNKSEIDETRKKKKRKSKI